MIDLPDLKELKQLAKKANNLTSTFICRLVQRGQPQFLEFRRGRDPVRRPAASLIVFVQHMVQMNDVALAGAFGHRFFEQSFGQ